MGPSGQPVLTTERLVLHPLALRHLPLVLDLDSDPEVMRFLGGGIADPGRIEAAHRRRLDMASAVPGLGHWMAFEKASPEPARGEQPEPERFVGLVMLPPAHGPDQPDDPTVADLGYRLHPSAWGRGLGREAARGMLGHAFETVRLRRVIAQTRSDNAASRRLLEDVGMRLVRTFRSAGDDSDGPLDVEYDMDAERWRAMR